MGRRLLVLAARHTTHDEGQSPIRHRSSDTCGGVGKGRGKVSIYSVSNLVLDVSGDMPANEGGFRWGGALYTIGCLGIAVCTLIEAANWFEYVARPFTQEPRWIYSYACINVLSTCVTCFKDH